MSEKDESKGSALQTFKNWINTATDISKSIYYIAAALGVIGLIIGIVWSALKGISFKIPLWSFFLVAAVLVGCASLVFWLLHRRYNIKVNALNKANEVKLNEALERYEAGVTAVQTCDTITLNAVQKEYEDKLNEAQKRYDSQLNELQKGYEDKLKAQKIRDVLDIVTYTGVEPQLCEQEERILRTLVKVQQRYANVIQAETGLSDIELPYYLERLEEKQFIKQGVGAPVTDGRHNWPSVTLLHKGRGYLISRGFTK